MKELDLKEIVKLLPHRYPFLLIDKILSIDLEKGVVIGQKNVTINESFFQGHFPEAPIMPGVLILEALAQNGGVLVHMKSDPKKVAILLNANNIKFRKPVRPGDVLILKSTQIHLGLKGGKIHAEAYVNDQLVVEADVGFVLVDKDQL